MPPPLDFTGGDRLMQHLDRISNAALASGEPEVKVGFLAGSTYPDGTSVPLVAVVNEFGNPAKGQPPRPYFRTMLKEKAPTWGADMGKVLVAANYNAVTTLGRMGELIKGQLVQSIKDLTSPPLAPSTVARKGFTKPLIDTGVMWNSVDYEVKS
ncbi:MAG: hypothetical protein P4L90_26080 [Rhodopila sp.]|nr:hypothetical protein [Rhodopila sp.]